MKKTKALYKERKSSLYKERKREGESGIKKRNVRLQIKFATTQFETAKWQTINGNCVSALSTANIKKIFD